MFHILRPKMTFSLLLPVDTCIVGITKAESGLVGEASLYCL